MDMSTPSALTHETRDDEAGAGLPSLGQILMNALLSDENITDVTCATDQLVRVRRTANNWAVWQDANGQEVRVSQPMIVALLNGVYEAEEQPVLYELGPDMLPLRGPDKKFIRRLPAWYKGLNERKSLHPSATWVDKGKDGSLRTLRVRLTVQKQDMGGAIGLMVRALRPVPEDLEKLGLPIQVGQLAAPATSGLLVVTGPTGSGKSTTIAAILQKYNTAPNRAANVVTLEDPVEFIYENDRCFFNQREIGVDVQSFEQGVIDAMRFAIDIIVIGEIRTAETMRAALRAAESGHLVLATTHAPSPVAAVRKMLAYLDNSSDAIALGNSLVGVVSQALLPDINDPGKKHLVCEVMPGNLREVKDAIASGESRSLAQIEDFIRTTKESGALSFRAGLERLVRDGKISPMRAAQVVPDAEDRKYFMSMSQATRGAAGAGRPPVAAAPVLGRRA